MFPHAQFLSNGKYVTAVTNAGGGGSFCDRMAVTRLRQDGTCDPGSHFIYLRDIRSGSVWSPTFHPTRREPESYLATFQPDKAIYESRNEQLSARLEVAVAPEHDVEVRYLQLINHSDRVREIDITSYVEIVLTQARDDYAHPAFGKLFIETEYLPERSALLCHRRPRDSRETGTWAMHVMSLEGRPQGPLEWETDRARFIGRGRTLENPVVAGRPAAVGHHRVRARSDPQPAPARAAAGRANRCASALPPASRPIAKPPRRWPRPIATPAPAPRTLLARARARAERAPAHGHLERRGGAVRAAGLARDRRRRVVARAGEDMLAANELGQTSLWPHGISGDLPIFVVRVVDDELGLVRQALEAQEYWRLKGLKADLVILNEHPISYMDEAQSRLTSLLDDGPWRMWKHQPGGAFLLRTDAMGQAERHLFLAVARAVLETSRGDLRAHLARPPQAPIATRAARAAAGRAERASDAAGVAEHGRQRAATDAAQRARRLCRQRRHLRDRARRRPGNAGAVVERDREPALRHRAERLGRRHDVVRQQPREPPDAVCQRPGQRPVRRGDLHSRRRHRPARGRRRRDRWCGRRRAAAS